MNNIKQVERAYQTLLNNYRGQTVAENRINTYVCPQCKTYTVTIDIAPGVTPFLHECQNCGDMAQSTFYCGAPEGVKPSQEWYRPTLEECITMFKTGNINQLEHVLHGGLLPRIIEVDSPDIKDCISNLIKDYEVSLRNVNEWLHTPKDPMYISKLETQKTCYLRFIDALKGIIAEIEEK